MLKRFLKHEQGNILILAAIAIPVLSVGVGSAVEMSRYMNAKAKFAQALDNSLLSAAAVAHTQDVSLTAKNFFKANYTDTAAAQLTGVQINVATVDNGNAWTIKGHASVNTSFVKFLGLKSINLDHQAKVIRDASRQTEIVFTADTSASMCMNTTRAPKQDNSFVMEYAPDPTCEKLEALKQSLSYVLEEGIAPIQVDGSPAYKVGIVPFNHKVHLPNLANIPEPLSYIETTHAKGSANYYTNFTDATPLAPVVPLTALTSSAQQIQLVNKINAITQTPTGLGWTRSNIATLTAALMLDPDYNASFGGDRPNVFDPTQTDKVVVMMTDGANIGCCYASFPEGDYSNQYLYLYEADNAHLTGLAKAPNMEKWKTQYNIPDKGICDQLKEQGVTIYSVVFDVDDRDPGGKAIKDAYLQCASNQQFYFDVSNSAELKLAYKTIAQSFMHLRIAE